MVEATRQKILNAYRHLAVHHGIKGATTAKIAELAGVSEVTLFRYFKDKKALMLTTVQEGRDDFLKFKQASVYSEDLMTDLLNIAKYYIEFSTSHQDILVLYDDTKDPNCDLAIATLDLINQFKAFIIETCEHYQDKAYFKDHEQIEWVANNLIWISLGMTDNGRFDLKYQDPDFYYQNLKQFIQLVIDHKM